MCNCKMGQACNLVDPQFPHETFAMRLNGPKGNVEFTRDLLGAVASRHEFQYFLLPR